MISHLVTLIARTLENQSGTFIILHDIPIDSSRLIRSVYAQLSVVNNVEILRAREDTRSRQGLGCKINYVSRSYRTGNFIYRASGSGPRRFRFAFENRQGGRTVRCLLPNYYRIY